eukprot:2195924-Rhodomonas_salina.7
MSQGARSCTLVSTCRLRFCSLLFQTHISKALDSVRWVHFPTTNCSVACTPSNAPSAPSVPAHVPSIPTHVRRLEAKHGCRKRLRAAGRDLDFALARRVGEPEVEAEREAQGAPARHDALRNALQALLRPRRLRPAREGQRTRVVHQPGCATPGVGAGHRAVDATQHAAFVSIGCCVAEGEA